MKLGTYIMAPEINSRTYFMNPSVLVSLCVSTLFLGNVFLETLPRQRIHAKKGIVGQIVFYAVRMV
jgi:hypothetical protein